MNILRLSSLSLGTALATLTLPQPFRHSTSAPEEKAEPIVYRHQFQTSPPPARMDIGPGWSATEQTIEQDVEAYRSRSSEQLETIGLAIQGLGQRCDRAPFAGRSYLRTRVEALREHLDYAREELTKLPGSQSDESFQLAHANFYRTMASLQDAFSQAAEEMNDQR